jgi:hypothetical protein
MPLSRRVLMTALLAAPVPACATGAAAAEHIRGTITSVTGSYIRVRTMADRTLTVAVPANAPVSVVVPAAFGDIHDGSYVGTAAVPGSDGTLRALEVHLFPDGMQGMGQGSHPWDLRPGSTMTAGVVSRIEGRRLTVIWRGGQRTVTVPPGVPIVTYAETDADPLVPGAHVVIAADPSTDGLPRADRIVVGRNGLIPPM